MHHRVDKTGMLCNAYDDMASFSYQNTRGVTLMNVDIASSLLMLGMNIRVSKKRRM
jgi:hypothetical protein